MLSIRNDLTPAGLLPKIERMWAASAEKIRAIAKSWDPVQGAPVFTVEGRYTSKGWTEWTQGFQFGAALLQFDATGDEAFLEMGRLHTFGNMAGHVTHMGVHDHGFNNVSTYGNLWRLITEKRIPGEGREKDFHELALKASGAVQAARWTGIQDGRGFIHSFNGPHSLFADTIRSLRSLALAHKLGHVLMEEKDERVSLLERLVQHAQVTAQYSVFYGEGRDAYDQRGRVAHEIIFNTTDGSYRCPNSQQGYSPFTTWTRGLAWIMLGFAEQLEFLSTVTDAELEPLGGRKTLEGFMLKAARAACDFYIANSPADGIPYWDTGAPGLAKLGAYLDGPADPFNAHEPVDSSAAAIACQGLMRLGHWMHNRPEAGAGAGSQESEAGGPASLYWQAGLTVLDRVLSEPYISLKGSHQGLILHAVYHRPNGWDHVPEGQTVPCGESCMWGDYHAREAALYVQRLARGEKYYAFFGA